MAQPARGCFDLNQKQERRLISPHKYVLSPRTGRHHTNRDQLASMRPESRCLLRLDAGFLQHLSIFRHIGDYACSEFLRRVTNGLEAEGAHAFRYLG